MNTFKRRAKRIPNHAGNEDMIVYENEKPLLNLIARILADIFLKEMEEENLEKEPKVPDWKRPQKKSI
ncbi:hypothetical protein [Pedobacter punctiformis]|uniref:Uncharacterized protein n=1 Tax=Pedobacter punctiformis TaxID=3004097 RepID=A0ABT4L8F9_9SPHI|nr:hypothetical protein [Pedobacter sp. HCMS5-2]MCZ4243977.1 hypothetical protein [Pedobacter sp. HCMS5-2]